MSLADKALRAAMLTLAAPPLDISRALGAGMGRLALMLDSRHRRIIRDNLRQSFPERDEAWVRKTAAACYAHLGKVAMEIPRLLRCSPEQILARTRFHGDENVAEGQRLQAEGKGALLLTGHIGNWEWASLAAGLKFGPACLVARPIDWPPADRMVNQWRTRTGHEVVPKAGSARRILGQLKKGGAVGVLLDQNVDWYDGEWVDFFGRPACTNKGLALLAMRTGCPVFPFHSFRADDGVFDLYFGPRVELVDSGDKTQDVWENTQRFTKVLEEIIRRRPEQWFWLHQRWKTKPFHPWPRQG